MYRQIIKKSIRLTLKNKKLWLFGLAAALLGNGGELELFLKNAERAQNLPQRFLDLPNFFQNNLITEKFILSLKNLAFSQKPILSFLILIFLGLLIWLIIIAQGALIKTIGENNKQEAKSRLSWQKMKKYWIVCRQYFWELLFINIVLKGGVFVISLLVTLPIYILLTEFSPKNHILFLSLIFFAIFTPLGIISSFLTKYALCYLIIGKKHIGEAILKSFILFRDNWLITLENAILLYALNLIFAVLMLILGLIISFPALAGLSLAFYPQILKIGYMATIIALILMPIGLLTGSLLAVFQYSVWTKLFLEIKGRKKILSKLARSAAALPKKLGLIKQIVG